VAFAQCGNLATDALAQTGREGFAVDDFRHA
jgi:hypothetical protein